MQHGIAGLLPPIVVDALPRRYIPGDIDLLLGNVDLDRGYQLTDAGHRFDGHQKTAVCSVRLVLVEPGQLQGTGLPWRQGTGPVHLERGQVVEGDAPDQHPLQRGAGSFLAERSPHHNFHVFDVHSRVGELEHSLETMDQCRISWGKVLKDDGSELVVERQPLAIVEGKLALGASIQERAARQVGGRGFADEATTGVWVSLHWGWVCEVITPLQQHNLARYTVDHIRLANLTM
jgi:hypothetical protein